MSISRRALLALALLPGCVRRSRSGEARVVSVSPSTTEGVCAVGACATLVGRSEQCDYPASVAGLPTVGGFASPSLEAVLTLHPTLVVGAQGPAGRAIADGLRAAGVATYFPRTETIAEILAMLRGLGVELGLRDGGERAAKAVERAKERVEIEVAGLPKVRAVFVFDANQLFAAGPGSYADELLRVAGGENVVKRGNAYPKVGVEALAALDPEVILDGTGKHGDALASYANREGLRGVTAVRNKRVHTVDDTVLRPGPRVGEGLASIAKLLHESR